MRKINNRQLESEQAARRVVQQARLFRLLARRLELSQPDRADRVARALPTDAPGPLPLLDAAAVASAGELDQLCGHAVRMLAKGGQVAGVLDLLGNLSPERVAAIWWALPPHRRRVIYRDDACGYHVAQYRDYLPAAEIELEQMIADTPATSITYDLAREMLPYGEPHAL
jgi:hypothetical protein